MVVISDRQEDQLKELKDRIYQLERENQKLRTLVSLPSDESSSSPSVSVFLDDSLPTSGLSKDHIERYSRQLLLQDGFGVTGQQKLLSSSVLVVGAGGIGSTVILYLAASGIGNIGIVDFDDVEMSNLHRQIIHKERNAGMNKAISACQAAQKLNPTIKCDAITERLNFDNATRIIANYDIVVDASDNPQTRYIINDACVLEGKPLVSGSAVGIEGQLTVYNYMNGPCYRCLYPKPKASAGCLSCSDAGVLGPVPGLIGTLQAVECIKILTGIGEVMSKRMLHYDSLQTSFTSFKKPQKQPKCIVCGPYAIIRSMKDSQSNLETVRGPDSSACNLLMADEDDDSISCADYMSIRDTAAAHVLLDVRVEKQFEMCSIEGSLNIPLAKIPENLGRIQELSAGSKTVYCICRRGIASVQATSLLLKARKDYPAIHSVRNIAGGLQAWQKAVDFNFPKY